MTRVATIREETDRGGFVTVAAAVDLELHQLDRRYEALRTTSQERDSRVLASLARDGQQLPVVVIAGEDASRYVLVDGYKRIRGLHKLGQDLVRAVCWDLPEEEALLLGRLMRSAEGESVLEQAWLVRELSERFGLWLEDLARRFGRSPSLVSRRLGLVATLPDAIQQLVRDGKLAPHAAMKHLLPLARANRAGSHRAGAGHRPAASEHTADRTSMRCFRSRQRQDAAPDLQVLGLQHQAPCHLPQDALPGDSDRG